LLTARAQRGFTLVELMIAMAAMAIVLVYTLGTFTANRDTYVVIDNVSEAHQNTLAIAALIERDVRNAGYMVPAAGAACGLDRTNGPDILLVSDAEAIRTADALPAALAKGDLRTKVQSAFPATWTGTLSVTLDKLSIDDQATYDTDATVGPDSDFRPDGGVIFFDDANPSRGVGCGIVTAVDTGAKQISFTPVSAPGLGAGGAWYAVPAHVYQITGNVLRRDGILMARNVEDLQVAWFYDDNDNGQVDAGEYVGGAGTQLVTSALPNAADPNELREIRFDLVVRTAEDDPANPTHAGIGQATENQTVVPPADGRRRRVTQTTVRLRNLVS
jgi:prepilin-type N-terminal cleavage/methylation domain-containing protein